MRSVNTTPETAAGLKKAQAERENLLVIEDRRGAQTAFPLFLSQNEYLFALRGNEDFLGSPRSGDRYSSWNGLSTRTHKIFLAQEAMKDLSHWYEQIFRDADELDEDEFAEKQRFLNSNLTPLL